MKNKMKRMTLIALGLITFVGGSIFARTPTMPNDVRFSRGVSNCCYYIDWTASGYQNQVVSASNNWVDTGYGWNPIYMTSVSSNYATHMDFYGRNAGSDSYLNNSVVGYTSYWNTDGSMTSQKGQVPTYNYFYTEIVFNTDLSESYDYRIAKHEMGHAFGLLHTEDRYSIMYPTLFNMMVSTVQQGDHDAINYLYNR